MQNTKTRVLLIEDNPGDIRIIREMLSNENSSAFDLEYAKRLHDGFKCLDTKEIDVILLDLGLPESNGLETFTQAYSKAQHVPIVILTSSNDEMLGIRGVREGAQDYLIKNEIDTNLLKRSLYYAIERKHAEEKIKQSLKEKELLLLEIHHRIKNNLQIVSSLLNMQAQVANDEYITGILYESRNRINAMALIHTQLYESKSLSEINIKDFIKRLMNQLLQSYFDQDTRITQKIHVSDHMFPISTAVSVGLIINELLTNAVQHAFDSRKDGRIEIILNTSKEERVNLTIKDNGNGLPEGFDIDTTKTLGMRLVKLLVEDQQGGHMEIINKQGTAFNMEFNI